MVHGGSGDGGRRGSQDNNGDGEELPEVDEFLKVRLVIGGDIPNEIHRGLDPPVLTHQQSTDTHTSAILLRVKPADPLEEMRHSHQIPVPNMQELGEGGRSAAAGSAARPGGLRTGISLMAVGSISLWLRGVEATINAADVLASSIGLGEQPLTIARYDSSRQMRWSCMRSSLRCQLVHAEDQCNSQQVQMATFEVCTLSLSGSVREAGTCCEQLQLE